MSSILSAHHVAPAPTPAPPCWATKNRMAGPNRQPCGLNFTNLRISVHIRIYAQLAQLDLEEAQAKASPADNWNL